VCPKLPALLTTAVLLAGCGWPPWPPTEVPISELLDAPEMLALDNRIFTLYACPNRDFQPHCPPDGYPMSVYVQVYSDDSLPCPQDLDADKVWVIRRSARKVWEADLRDVTGWNPFGFLRKVASGGPKWDPGLKVDVIVRLCWSDGSAWLIRAADVEISQTW